ncbi:MAG: hypothetical protein JO020_17555 [Chloroflexi bacterium]|nr:hypothetical protein [Chloroflexota bacterium]MBV9895971.1 hypothetical protein [Chloroflexota bacterium]
MLDTRQTAVDAMRSLRYLEESAVTTIGHTPLPHLDLFQPPELPRLNGPGFLEFAVDADAGRQLGPWLQQLGFAPAGRHR